MTSGHKFSQFFKIFLCEYYRRKGKFILQRPHENVTRALGLLITAHAFSKNKKTELALKPPDPSLLTTQYLIKNAASTALDSAITLLNQTVTSLMEIEDNYINDLDRLIKLLEINLKVLGDTVKEDKVWDRILKVRADLAATKDKRQMMTSLFCSSDRLITSAAEAAYTAGAEYSATAASELLQKARVQIKKKRRLSEEMERVFLQKEAENIAATTKNAKKPKPEKPPPDFPDVQDPIDETDYDPTPKKKNHTPLQEFDEEDRGLVTELIEEDIEDLNELDDKKYEFDDDKYEHNDKKYEIEDKYDRKLFKRPKHR